MTGLRLLTAAAAATLCAAETARACAAALVLAMDVSGSVDAGEYRLQVEGLATALADPEVREVMLAGEVAVAVVQWSAAHQQMLSVPFRRMTSAAEIDALAAAVRRLPRAFAAENTAPAAAIAFAAAQFDDTPDCARRIIDISGDGAANDGGPVRAAVRDAWAAGIEINGLAIEDPGQGLPITRYYRETLVTPGGFVVTARGSGDFARAMRVKLIRELTRPTG